MSRPGWQFWIDRGGTFTDVIASSPDGRMIASKWLSENPDQYTDAAVAGITSILAGEPPGVHVDAIKMGTTVATNALLERAGEPTVLVTTQGFGDALRIGYQDRPDIFALDIQRPALLHGPVIEAAERIDSDGVVLQALDTEQLRIELAAQREAGYRAVAICFLHGYQHPQHEQAAGEIARALGYDQVSLSHATSPLIRFVSRGDTTVADAYLSPVLDRYTAQLAAALDAAGLRPDRLLFMQSNGGLVERSLFRGKDSVLSGPAGGVVGMAAACEDAGNHRLIGFDMGGTSTDVSLYDDGSELVTDSMVAGVRLRAPMIRIHTVAAGGGSLLKFEDGRFQVGPGSAGADPGPASYRRGGPLTVTDANLLLGRIVPAHFPAVFGPDGDQPLDQAAVTAAFGELTKVIATAGGQRLTDVEVAAGFVRVAVDNMANAIKTVSLQRGYDPADFTLCSFGGAGGQHACQVADALGIREIIVHPLAGVLSAWGMGVAPLASYRQAAAGYALDDSAGDIIRHSVAQLAEACVQELVEQGVARERIGLTTTLNVRIPGTDTSLPVSWRGSAADASAEFHAQHRQRFGFGGNDEVPEIESLRVAAAGTAGEPNEHREAMADADSEAIPVGSSPLFCDGEWAMAAIYHRSGLAAGVELHGPAIVLETNATTVVDKGWMLRVDTRNRLRLSRSQPPQRATTGTAADPVLLEVFNNHFMNIAEQMGAVLAGTAHSVNIKERLDFFCALFDSEGGLVANAPHIPVHLGSMSDSVRAVMEAGDLRRGDSWMLNDPFRGGTHLPDITVVTPVFIEAEAGPRFVVASRAHHADIGGITPGSMPAFSRNIHDEGVCFEPVLLVRNGQLLEAALRQRLTSGSCPARNPDRNVADLRAQLAANERGQQCLHDMIHHFGLAAVTAYMTHVSDNAEAAVRAAIRSLQPGQGEARLDDGSIIHVQLLPDPSSGQVRVDFTGTSPRHAGNLNAPAGIARAAVLYAFRCLVDRPVPLNAGCLRPLELVIPPDTLLSPAYPDAVVAGNVETSQCVANAVLAAAGALAGSQGTMNNLSFGDARHQYYETICGGAGAGASFDGASAVHTHMTNSRITDPEILEQRLPVLLREFAIRAGSGGAGRYRGGDGVIRAIEFRAAMHVAIVSNHRLAGPPGLAGGDPGKRGINMLVRQDESVEYLPAVAEVDVGIGDMIVIATPGGGGYGPAGQRG